VAQKRVCSTPLLRYLVCALRLALNAAPSCGRGIIRRYNKIDDRLNSSSSIARSGFCALLLPLTAQRAANWLSITVLRRSFFIARTIRTLAACVTSSSAKHLRAERIAGRRGRRWRWTCKRRIALRLYQYRKSRSGVWHRRVGE